MALKRKISAAEHATLAEPLKEQYRAEADGFILDAEGFDDTAGLKRALDAEREANKKAAQELAKERERFAGIDDPDSAREALKQKHELEEQKLLKAGDVDKIVEKRTEAMRRDWDNREKVYKQQLEQKDAELKSTTAVLSEKVVDGAIRDAFTKTGGRATAVEDVILRGRQIFRMKDGKAVPMKGDEIIYGKDAGSPMSTDEWVGQLTTTAPHLFEPSNGSGAENKRNGTAGGFVISRDAARDPQKYQAMKAAASKAGQEVTIAAQ